jgi:putative tricarboxylic transport membrane protein
VKLSDAVFGLVLLALALTVLAIAASYPTVAAQRVGPALFPSLIAIGLAVGGVFLIVRGWRQRATVPMLRWDPWARSKRHVSGLVAVIASVVFYVATVNRLGFLLTSFAILLVLLRVFTVPWQRSIVIAVIASLAIHFAFYKLLRVPLPWGVLAPVAW